MESKNIQNLIKFISKSGVAEVSYKTSDFELTVKNVSENPVAPPVEYTQAAPIPQAPVQNQAALVAESVNSEVTSSEEKASTDNLITIKSPMIGTFYRKPSPDKPLFVNVGDVIEKGQVVCMVEAMKLFNEIESEVSGTIVKVLIDDASPVEFDQPLFLVEPS